MNFKQRLREDGSVFGIFSKTNDPFFVEVMGRVGFDFVILDNEHGPNSPRDLYPLLLASEATGMYPIVRVGKLSDIEIQRVMDLGVAGVQIPQIQCREDAENVRLFTKYHPSGMRGVCRFVRAAQFSLKDRNEYFRDQNELTNVIHIEGMEGIGNLDEIIEVADIDIIFVGPYDLSQSLGIPGQIDHPKLWKEVEVLVEKCSKKEKYIGTFTDTFEAAQRFKNMGVKYISYQTDVGIFADSCKDVLGRLRQL